MANGRTGGSRAGSGAGSRGGPWTGPGGGGRGRLGPPRFDPAAFRRPPADGASGRTRFVEGSLAFHPEHGLVDVLAVVGPQRLIRVQPGRSPSEISVLAVHVDELSPVERGGATGLPEG